MPHGCHLADQDKKSGLKRVGNVVRVAKGAVADAKNHGSMSGDQDSERCLDLVVRRCPGPYSLDQLPIGGPAQRPRAKENFEVTENRRRVPARHECDLLSTRSALSMPARVEILPVWSGFFSEWARDLERERTT
ncbi:MAG: hypothetical protein NVSMB9_13910 [Isosphaeraceae bacterium]